MSRKIKYMEFSCHFAESVAKLSKTRVSYAWLLLLTLLASVLMVLNKLMAVKRLSALCVPFKWHSIWTIDRISNFTEFKTTIPLRKTLNLRQHLCTNTGRQSERCFGNDIGSFNLWWSFWHTQPYSEHLGSSKWKAR